MNGGLKGILKQTYVVQKCDVYYQKNYRNNAYSINRFHDAYSSPPFRRFSIQLKETKELVYQKRSPCSTNF